MEAFSWPFQHRGRAIAVIAITPALENLFGYKSDVDLCLRESCRLRPVDGQL
jgi:hypothetical protein